MREVGGTGSGDRGGRTGLGSKSGTLDVVGVACYLGYMLNRITKMWGLYPLTYEGSSYMNQATHRLEHDHSPS